VQARLGKEVGNDFREGKMTLPVLLAFERGSADEKAFWQRTLENRIYNEADLGHAIELLQKHGALATAVERAHQYAQTSSALLSGFAETPLKTAMLESVAFVVDRDY